MLPNLLGGKLLTGVLPLNTHETGSTVADIESCIDNPTLAPLGNHIRLLSDKPERHGKECKTNTIGQVKIQQRRDIRQKCIYGTGLLMLRRKNLTTDELAQQLNANTPLASFLDQQQLLLQHNHWFDGLVELNISRNKLTSLPIEITNLTCLRILNASSNLLTHLPTELNQLTQLQVLNLSQNQLYTIPDELPLQLPSLVTLLVAGNLIDYLTPNVNRWIHLQHLQLGSVFGGNRLTQLPNTIGDMPCLEELDISFNQLRTLPATMVIPSLVNLNVSRNQLDSLPSSIGQCHVLRTLNVSKNYLTSLPTTLVNLDNLELLDISENLLCIMPADILERMKGTLLVTGNPLTRPGQCDDSDDAYTLILKRMAMHALPMVSTPFSTSSSDHQHGPQGNGCLSSQALTLASPSQDTSTPTHIISSPPSLDHHHEDHTDHDAMLDRELSFLAQQLNVQGATRDRQQLATISMNSSPPQQEDPSSITLSHSTQPTTPSLFSSSSSSITSTSTSTSTSNAETATQDGDRFSRSLLMEATETALDVDDIEDTGTSCFTMDTTTTTTNTTTINMIHSLRELATRAILQSNQHHKIPLDMIPPHLAYDLSSRNRRRWCANCQQPFVNEWLTSVQVKGYGGHPAVVHRVQLCSTRCWKLYLLDRAPSVICVHLPDTQPIVQDENENDPFDTATHSLVHPSMES